MPDPRDELAYADMANEPGFLPPREPLRIRVSPYDTPPPSDTGWGGFGAGGRPAGRLFEPDLDPAVPEQPPWQGGRLFEPDRSPVPPKPQFQPGLLSLGNVPRVIGGLVQGAGDGASAPPAATAPPFVAPPRGRSNAPFDPMAGVRPDSYPKTAQPTFGENLATGVGHAATEVLQEPYNMVRAGQDIAAPGATDQQVQQAREQEAAAATNLTTNLYGLNAPFSAARPGASAGVFGGPLAKGYDPAKEKLAQLMEQNGVSAPQIWKDTGLVKFADGKWAHEISDLGAYYKGDVDSIASRIFDQKYPDRAGTYGQGVRPGNMVRSDQAKMEALLKMQQKLPMFLPDVLHHPELFKKYPELLKMPVSQDAMMHAQGAYAPQTASQSRSIMYREQTQPGKMARGATFDTLLHEVQHAIAQIEGFAKGSNTNTTLARMEGTPANILYKKELERMPVLMELDDYLKAHAARGNPKGVADWVQYYDKGFTEQEIFKRQAQEYAVERAYLDDAGENLANLSKDRKNLTPEQARAIHPPGQMRVPLEQQGVQFNPIINPQGTTPQQMGGVLNPAPREMQAITIRDAGVRVGHENVAGLTRPDHVYRGMTADEFNATIGAGKGVKSRQDFSTRGEGTSWAKDAETAESYVNFGHDDPRVTDKTTYLVETRGGEDFKLTRDGYFKTDKEIARDQITRIIEMRREGDKIVGREINPTPREMQMSGPSGLMPPKSQRKAQGSFNPLDEADVTWKGKPMAEWKPQDWKEVGDHYGVKNLGPLSPVEKYVSPDGYHFEIPGGTKGTWTYYDLLHMKANPINPNNLPHELHAEMQRKLGRTMTPHGEVGQDQIWNGLMFGMTSSSNPLFPNQMSASRLRLRDPKMLDALADSIPWKAGDEVSKEVRGAKDLEIRQMFNLHEGKSAGSTGLGTRGSLNYTYIAELAQMFRKNPEWFRKKADEDWTSFVERLATQTKGLSMKTGSFSSVWQDPYHAAISAIDRHMAKEFERRGGLFLNAAEQDKWQAKVLKNWNKELPADQHVGNWKDLTQQRGFEGFMSEELLNYVGAHSKKEFRNVAGEINPSLPKHVQEAKTFYEPSHGLQAGAAYKRALAANQKAANEQGLNLFMSQWFEWDRIRQRFEPHENMFPGLSRMPAPSKRQLDIPMAAHLETGHRTYDYGPTGRMNPTEKSRRSPSEFGYLGVPLAAGGAAGIGSLVDPSKYQPEAR